MIQENHEEYVTPVAAFVTFRTQEGYERCLKYMACENNFLDQPVFTDPQTAF